jgi:hypothetical protein
MMNKQRWAGRLGVALLLGLTTTLLADARDDLSRAKSDFDNVKSHFDSSKSGLDKYLEGSVKLRAMDKDQLNDLVTQLCKLDVKRDDDEADRLAKDLRDKVISNVRSEYDRTTDAGAHVLDDLGHLEGEAKTLRSRVKDLESTDEVKSDAEHLRSDIEKLQDEISKLFDRFNADHNTLDRVKDGVMNGSNNPTIRARMEYGKEMHKKLQSDNSCDERETSLSSGRPDCIKFDQDDCKVIEFKPDTYSTSAAESQASKYLNDVRDKFKSDDRAKKCKWNSDGPIFRPVGQLYAACRVP